LNSSNGPQNYEEGVLRL